MPALRTARNTASPAPRGGLSHLVASKRSRVNVKDLWDRLRSGVELEVIWDFTPHGSSVGARWRITKKTAGAAAGTILPGTAPFRFGRYKASEIRIDGPDTYTVLAGGVPQRTLRIIDATGSARRTHA